MNPKKKRKYLYQLRSLLTRSYAIAPDTVTAIDVIIPVIEKDLAILPYCLEGVRRCVPHRISRIYLVAPPLASVMDFCRDNGLAFVDENTVLGFGVKDIRYTVDGNDRSGWIFQQLLKMSGTIGTCEYFLVVDADHILIRPHTFLTADGKTVFYQSREYHEPYYVMLERLTGQRFSEGLSYVDHKMLFCRSGLEALKTRMEAYCGTTWVEAVLQRLDVSEPSCFSEYESYGLTYPESEKCRLPWRNKSLTADRLLAYDELVARYARRYLSLTFPDYKNH